MEPEEDQGGGGGESSWCMLQPERPATPGLEEEGYDEYTATTTTRAPPDCYLRDTQPPIRAQDFFRGSATRRKHGDTDMREELLCAFCSLDLRMLDEQMMWHGRSTLQNYCHIFMESYEALWFCSFDCLCERIRAQHIMDESVEWINRMQRNSGYQHFAGRVYERSRVGLAAVQQGPGSLLTRNLPLQEALHTVQATTTTTCGEDAEWRSGQKVTKRVRWALGEQNAMCM